jgi:hypothetical protein
MTNGTGNCIFFLKILENSMQAMWERRSNHNTAGCRRQAVGKISGHCGLQLVSAIDAQNGQFFADSCDRLLVGVADEIAPVGDPALEGLKLDWAGLERERADAVGVDVVGDFHFFGSFLANATGKSSITRDR